MSNIISRCKKACKAFLGQEDSTYSTPQQGDASQAPPAKSKEVSPSKGLTKKESQEIRNSLNSLETQIAQELKSIKSSLEKLQANVSELSKSIKSGLPSPTPSATPKRGEESVATTNQRKEGWFPAPEQEANEKYFKELLSKQNGDARFKASVVNDEAFFRPSDNITLTTLQSSDVLERVIQYEGVSKEKASHMEIVREGIAIREKSYNSWTVKENVLIRLS